jgi:hypothetical protein
MKGEFEDVCKEHMARIFNPSRDRGDACHF